MYFRFVPAPWHPLPTLDLFAALGPCTHGNLLVQQYIYSILIVWEHPLPPNLRTPGTSPGLFVEGPGSTPLSYPLPLTPYPPPPPSPKTPRGRTCRSVCPPFAPPFPQTPINPPNATPPPPASYGTPPPSIPPNNLTPPDPPAQDSAWKDLTELEVEAEDYKREFVRFIRVVLCSREAAVKVRSTRRLGWSWWTTRANLCVLFK